MAETPTHFLSMAELGERYRPRSLSSVEVTRQALTRIASLDAALNSFITVLQKESLAQAETAARSTACPWRSRT